MTIYVDMDGVIADFEKAMNEKGMAPKEFKMLRNTYMVLEVVPGARKGIKALQEMGYEIHIATKIPDDNPYAATEKLLWLRKHFPDLAVNVTITPNKGQLGNSKDFLIDDRIHKAKVSDFAGTVLHFGTEGKYKE